MEDMNIRTLLAVLMMTLPTNAYAEDDAMDRLQEMVNDLGGDMQMVVRNNGKVLKCSQGGTKKISIKFGAEISTYIATYDNCRENGKVRDVIYEIEAMGDEVLKDNEKPSKSRELFNAAVANKIDKLRSLLKEGAKVNVDYSMQLDSGGEITGFTPLMSASSNKNIEAVRLLIKEGAWVNYMGSEVRNALWYATYVGSTEVVKFLLENGAYINNSDMLDMTPVMAASINGDTEIVRLLIKYKAKLNMKHKDGDTALMFSIANGNNEIAKLLIDAGADVNAGNRYGITPLIISAVENNVEIARYLLDKKADMNAKTDFGKTALEIATVKGHTQIMQLLSGKN